MLVFQDAVLVALAPESKGAAGRAHSSNNAFASFKSTVLKPSVNQLYTGASRAWASWRLPCCCHSRARLVATRIRERKQRRVLIVLRTLTFPARMGLVSDMVLEHLDQSGFTNACITRE